MNEIEKWCRNKNYIIAIIAPQIVASAEPFHEFLTKLKVGKKIHKNEIPTDLEEWISLYRNHKKVSKYLRSFLPSISQFADSVISFLEMFEQLQKEIRRKGEKQFNVELKEEVAKLNEAEKNEIIDSLKVLFQMSMDDIDSDITNDFSVDTKKKFEAELNRPEFLFYIRVVVPCQLLYGIHPALLLRKARLGDIDSLKKLLRLDPSIIHDNKIKKIHHQSKYNKKSTFDSIVLALDKTHIKSVSAKRIKYSCAGLISAISEKVGSKLTEPEIRKLFEAYQVCAGKDKREDKKGYDLPYSHETFAKAIQRERKFWLNAINYPDKK